MRHLKRFKNWLVVVYYASWKLGERLQQKSKQAKSKADRVGLDDASAELEADITASSSEAVAVSKAPAPVQQQSASAKSEEIETPAEKVVTEARVANSAPVAPPAQVKKASKPEQKAKPVQQQPVAPPAAKATPAPAAPPPKPQAPPASPAVSVKAKPQGTNGAATEQPTTGGKYQPGAINDQTAQRLARLLVSEIKLYHKSKSEGVEAGEVTTNIYDMLKDPIEKSRQHYKQRMGKHALETMPDYFHSELVRTLCGGDASRLGPNYHSLDEEYASK